MGNYLHRRIKELVFIFLSFSFLIMNTVKAWSQQDTMEYTLDEVNITGQRTPAVYDQIARKVTVISKEDIAGLPASSIQDVLEYAAGVDLRQRNPHGVQADIQIRGGSFDQVMVLLNGMNISDPQTGHFNLDLPVSLASVERIEILHGSGSRIYGANAHKGVINIITSKDINNITATVIAGDHGLFHSTIGGNVATGKFYNGLNFSRNVSAGFTTNTDYRTNDLFYQGGVHLNMLDMSWQAGVNNKAFGANNFYSPRFPEQFEETGTTWAGLKVSSTGKIKFTGAGYYRRHNDHFLLRRNEPSFYENFHITNTGGFSLSAGFSTELGKSFVGIEDRIENIYSTSLGEENSKPVKVKGTDSIMMDMFYSRNNFSGFFEHNYTSGNFSVTGGFLVAVNSHFDNKASFFPGIDISQRLLDKKLKIFGSLNKSLRIPTFTDLFYRDPSNEGNKELNPEQLFSIETGAEFVSGNNTSNLTFFRDKGSNVIDWVWIPENSLYRALNISEVTTRGIEAAYRYKNSGIGRHFSLAHFGFSYTFIDLEKASGDYESKYSLDHLKHKFQFNISQNLFKGFIADLRVSYMSRNGSYLDYEPAEGEFPVSFEPYTLTDLKFTYAAGIFNVFVNVNNIFDIDYTDVGNLIQPGRWITGGLKVNILTR